MLIGRQFLCTGAVVLNFVHRRGGFAKSCKTIAPVHENRPSVKLSKTGVNLTVLGRNCALLTRNHHFFNARPVGHIYAFPGPFRTMYIRCPRGASGRLFAGILAPIPPQSLQDLRAELMRSSPAVSPLCGLNTAGESCEPIAVLAQI